MFERRRLERAKRVITKLCLLQDSMFSVYAHADEKDSDHIVVEVNKKTEAGESTLKGSISSRGVLSWERELASSEERELSAKISRAVRDAWRESSPAVSAKGTFDGKIWVPIAFVVGAILTFVTAVRMDGPRVAAWEGESTSRPVIEVSGGKLVVTFSPSEAPPSEVSAAAGGGRGPMKEIAWVGAPGENEGNRERSFALPGGLETLEHTAVSWTDGEGKSGTAILTAREHPRVSMLFWLSAFFMFGAAFYGGRGIAALAGRERR